MPVLVTCPTCHTRLKAADAAAGRTTPCPRCGGAVAVPARDETPPDIEVDDDPPPAIVAAKGPAGKRRAARQPATAGRGLLPLLLAGGGAAAVAAAVAGVLALTRPEPGAAPEAAGKAEPRPPARPAPVAPPAPAPAPEPGDPFAPAGPAERAAVTWLDDRAADQPSPIPQNPDRAKAVRAAHQAWFRDSLVGGFDKAGQADAPWAAKARDALRLRAAELADRAPSGFDHRVRPPSEAALAAAVAAGCDDPLVLYFRQRVDDAAGRYQPAERAAALRPVVAALWKSGYADVRKAHAVQNLMTSLLPADKSGPTAEGREWDARYWEAFDRAARDPDPLTQADVAALAEAREGYAVAAGRTREQAHAELAAHLEKAGAPEYTRLVVKGASLIRQGWDARGRGYADTVTDEGRRLLDRRMAAAEAALTAAYELDPDRPEAPARMLWVCVGRGHPRDVMEEWFARAMRADPDNAPACHAKIEYLHPKWYGTADDYLGFAWQCVRTRNTAGQLPWVPVAHLLANYPVPRPAVPAARLADLQPAYGGPYVWQVTQTALVLLTRAGPGQERLRGVFARLACVAGRYDVARRELAAVGDDAFAGGFADPRELDFYRRWATSGALPPPPQ